MGLFTVVSVALLLLAGLRLSSHPNLPTRDFQLRFASVDGLQEYSTVQLAGVRVGFVKSIVFTEDRKVGVTITLTEPDALLFRGHREGVDSPGEYYHYTINGNSVGERWIEILPGTLPTGAEPLIAGSVIEGVRPHTLNELTQKGYEILSKLDASVEALDAFSKDPRAGGDLRQIMSSFREVSKNLRAASSDTGLMMAGIQEKNENLSDSLETVIAKLDQGLITAPEDGGAAVGALTRLSPSTRNSSVELASLALNLKDTSASIKKAIRAIEMHSVGKKIDHYSVAAIQDLRSAAEEIQGITLDLKADRLEPEAERDLREASSNSKLALESAARILGRAVPQGFPRKRGPETAVSKIDLDTYAPETLTLETETKIFERDDNLLERYLYGPKKRFRVF